MENMEDSSGWIAPREDSNQETRVLTMDSVKISGKEISQQLRGELKKEIENAICFQKRAPKLAAVLVGAFAPSKIYVAAKEKACEETGIASQLYQLPESTSQDQLHDCLESLNLDPTIDGILLQLPLPGHLDENQAILHIHPDKDVDGLHPISLGRLLSGQPGFRPCTPSGVMHMLHETGVSMKGKHAVVIGRSTIVGKPMALLLAEKGADCTVTLAHSQTQNLPELCQKADILIAALGKPEFVRGSWLKPGSVVIDVGINRLGDGKIVGDVAFDEAFGVASAITPVPGGVGPMTIAMLLKNTVDSAKKRLG